MNDELADRMADRIVDRLLVLVNVAERLKGVETQVARYASDIDSEKRTRAEATKALTDLLAKFDDRLRDVERSNWKSAGAIVAAMFAIQIIIKFVPTLAK